MFFFIAGTEGHFVVWLHHWVSFPEAVHVGNKIKTTTTKPKASLQ